MSACMVGIVSSRLYPALRPLALIQIKKPPELPHSAKEHPSLSINHSRPKTAEALNDLESYNVVI